MRGKERRIESVDIYIKKGEECQKRERESESEKARGKGGRRRGTNEPKRTHKRRRKSPDRPNTRQINKHRLPLRRPHIPQLVFILILIVVVVVVARIRHALRVPITKHAAVDLPVLDEPLAAARVLAEEMLGVVPSARGRDRTGTFDRLAARRRGAERAVRFVVVVRAERFAVVDIECFIGKGFLFIQV